MAFHQQTPLKQAHHQKMSRNLKIWVCPTDTNPHTRVFPSHRSFPDLPGFGPQNADILQFCLLCFSSFCLFPPFLGAGGAEFVFGGFVPGAGLFPPWDGKALGARQAKNRLLAQHLLIQVCKRLEKAESHRVEKGINRISSWRLCTFPGLSGWTPRYGRWGLCPFSWRVWQRPKSSGSPFGAPKAPPVAGEAFGPVGPPGYC